MRAFTRSSTSSVCSPFFTKTAIGTPQARWRLMHQSGRFSTIEAMRLRPCGGTQRVSSIAFWNAAAVSAGTEVV